MPPPNNVFWDTYYPGGDSDDASAPSSQPAAPDPAPSSPYDILYPSLVQARADQAQNASNLPAPSPDPWDSFYPTMTAAKAAAAQAANPAPPSTPDPAPDTARDPTLDPTPDPTGDLAKSLGRLPSMMRIKPPTDDLPGAAPDNTQNSYLAPYTPLSKTDNFFDAHYQQASRIGNQYGFDPSLLLGLTAGESGWGSNDDTISHNNPFGLRKQGKVPLDYPSLDKAYDQWGNMWGPRVQGVGSDGNRFINALQQTDQHGYGTAVGSYNSEVSPDIDGGRPGAGWEQLVGGSIAGVQKRLPSWIYRRSATP